jgi:type IV pilus assembly protein PilE
MKKTFGFTLIELMIAIAIIGILAAIAYPNYTSYVIRSKLTEAQSTLSDYRVRMEQYYQDNRNYGSTAATCGVAMPVTTVRYFTYTCNWGATATNQGFRITASSAAGIGLGAAADYVFDIDEGNVRRTTKFKGATVSGTNCWITAQGASC